MTAFPYFDTWLWPAVAVHVVDGDTVDVLVDRGFRDTSEMRIRLYGVNTPERGQPGYNEATWALQAMVFDPNTAPNVGRPLICRTILPTEKYGRWLAIIRVLPERDLPGVDDVSTELIRLGVGVEYYGGTR